MTVIEARYVGPFKVQNRPWFTWQKYDLQFYANKALPILEKQFCGLYVFRVVSR
jgi:hypothetical protein